MGVQACKVGLPVMVNVEVKSLKLNIGAFPSTTNITTLSIKICIICELL